MRPAPGGVPGRGQPQLRQPLVGQGHQQVGERAALGGDGGDPRLGGQRDADLDRRGGQHRRGADGEPLDPVDRLVGRPHVELVAGAEPALQRLPEPVLQLAADVEERRRTRAAVEVLVGAAHRQVGRRQVHLDRAGGVAEVPQHERAVLPGQLGDGDQAGQRTGAVGHQRQDDDGDPLVQHRRQVLQRQALVDVGGELPDLQAAFLRDAGHDVPVGGEVVGAAHQHVPAGPGVGPRPQQLVEVHRGRVRDQHLTGPGAEHAGGQGVAHPRGLGHPPGPGPDQALSPLLLDHPGQGGGGVPRQAAQRVAVQVDPAVRAVVPGAVRAVAGEAVAERGEGIGGVELLGIGAGGHGPMLHGWRARGHRPR
ncbi:unannotated protein [freshwater metagenome]|uniref:Unannotated protein n=1 Tax=freshwater metagenome TaxID=449393 RepID=A0A6J7FZP8_9ZZZZ